MTEQRIEQREQCSDATDYPHDVPKRLTLDATCALAHRASGVVLWEPASGAFDIVDDPRGML